MLTLWLVLLALAGDEKKSVDVVCPLDGQRFTAVEITATNHWGGRDADGCPHAFKTTPLELLVWVCPGCGFAGRKADFQAKLTEAEKAVLREGLKPPAPHWTTSSTKPATPRCSAPAGGCWSAAPVVRATSCWVCCRWPTCRRCRPI